MKRVPPSVRLKEEIEGLLGTTESAATVEKPPMAGFVGRLARYEPKHVQTEAGALELAVRQLRGTEDAFRPIVDRLRTRTADLETLVRGMYVRGCRRGTSARSITTRSGPVG